MPLFVHQLDLFDERGLRQRVADGADLPEDFQTLPPQSAASSAVVIDALLKELEELTWMLDEALLTHIYQDEAEAAESHHAAAVDRALELSDTLRTYWPGLRYRYF